MNSWVAGYSKPFEPRNYISPVRLPFFDLLPAFYYKPRLSSRTELLECAIKINKPGTYFNNSSTTNWSKYSCEKNLGTTDFYINIACERRLIQKTSTPYLTVRLIVVLTMKTLSINQKCILDLNNLPQKVNRI
jgi:hypothetical protein